MLLLLLLLLLSCYRMIMNSIFVHAVRVHRKFLMQFPTSGRHRRLLAQAEMETGNWQAADKVGTQYSRYNRTYTKHAMPDTQYVHSRHPSTRTVGEHTVGTR